MNTSLRHVMAVLLGCFVLLFIQLNRVQVFQAEALQQNPANTRFIQREFERPRAEIRTRDGVVVAVSEPSEVRFDRQRVYPQGELYAHTVGFVSFEIGADGVERTYNTEITGQTAAQQLDDLTSLLDPDPDPGALTLTLDHALQEVARSALGERTGSVVALDVKSGGVRALWSWPSYDPNLVAANEGGASSASYQSLLVSEGNPLRARAYRDVAFPGSTFKVVTAASALDNDRVTLTDPVFESVAEYTPELTSRAITNFGGRTCGGNLIELLVQSCNTAFAEIAAEFLGPERMIRSAEAVGFNNVPPFDLPGTVASVYPTEYGAVLQPPSEELPAGLNEDTPRLAQTAIGQNDVAATPLQMALMIAGVANDGTIPTPHVVADVLDPDGREVSDFSPGPWRQAMDAETARDLQTALIEAGNRGSGNPATVEGLTIGVKTGTAQLGTDPPRSHAWIVAFGGRPGEDPELAVAVLVEGGEGSGEQTGGVVAGPIARQIFSTYFAG